MLRYQTRALRLLSQSHSFYSAEVVLPERKSTVRVHKYSTKAPNRKILNKIYQLSTDELKNISSNEWIDRVNVMKTFNFSESQSLEMISKHPDLLHVPPERLESTLRQWCQSSLSEEELRNILWTNPVLLEVDDVTLKKRYPFLSSLCSLKVLGDLFLYSPEVMLDDWGRVLEKLNYLQKVRGFQMGSIVNSRALSNSFEFIKFRFNLLEKCGIYRQMTLKPHKIIKYDKSIRQNPSLKDILLPDNEVFTSSVAKISIEEYDFCYELYSNDDEADKDTDEYDDEDSDSDSDALN